MNNIKIGCDVVLIARIEKMMHDETQMQKVFHPEEILRYDALHLAGIFAAKEAVMKALNIFPLPSWQSIKILNKETGRPYVTLSPDIDLDKNYYIDISISHDGEYAFATALLLQHE